MDKTEVHFFLEKLKQLTSSLGSSAFTSCQIAQLRSLHRCVVRMSDNLETWEEARNENPEVNKLVMDVEDLVFDAENIIDMFLVNAGGGVSPDLATELDRIEQEMELLQSEISNGKTLVVGLDEQVDMLVARLRRSDRLKIISIVGPPGAGKTTLAEKLYDEAVTKEIFDFCGWVNVSSQKYEKTVSEDVPFLLVEGKTYLFVLDDLWSIKALNYIRRCLPEGSTGNCIVLTSRKTGLFTDAVVCDELETHYIEPLSKEDSWKLLQAKVFGNEGSCPPQLEEIGKKVAEQCKGLPLAILEIGKLSIEDDDKTPERWDEIARSVAPSISTQNTLGLSYTDLPLHLKACFLYLGLFPQDYETPVRELIWLLIAEGFVIQQDTNESLEVTAQGYLNDLVDRNLVTVSRRGFGGSPKACRIQHYLEAFSFRKGMEEKFLAHSTSVVTNMESSYMVGMRNISVSRCYIGPPTIMKKKKLPPCVLKLRSLVCLTSDTAPYFPVFNENQFKLLKVLDLISIRIPFPNDIGNLVLLRYIALWSDIICLPTSVTKLFYLETLILSTEKTLTLPEDIWKMVKLRNLYDKTGNFHFQKLTRSNHLDNTAFFLKNLQNLHPLCPCSSCTEFLVTTPNIKKLGLSGNLVSASGYSLIPRWGLDLFEQLETLSLINTGLYSHKSIIDVYHIRWPSSLKRVTLRNTLLKWVEISLLGELENLEVLKLLDNACVVSGESSGDETDCDTSDLQFPQLKYLKMRRLDITNWFGHLSGCPSLEVLAFEECQQLEAIPTDIAQPCTLHTIEVKRCNPYLEENARDIVDIHKIECGDKNLNLRAIITS